MTRLDPKFVEGAEAEAQCRREADGVHHEAVEVFRILAEQHQDWPSEQVAAATLRIYQGTPRRSPPLKGKVAGGLGVLLLYWSGAIAEATSEWSWGRLAGAVMFFAGIWLLGRTGAFTRSARNGVSRGPQDTRATNMDREQGGT